MMGVLEGVRVGPLDPDATESFGQVSATHSARRLIRLHSQMYPPALLQALVLKLDEARTTAVLRHMDEVREYLAGCQLENGDPALPDGAELEGAQVRGEPGRKQVLTYTYRVESGRSAKWFVPYDGEGLPEAHELGTELQRIARAREVGLVAWDDQGHAKQTLDRENASLRRQVNALRAQVEGRGDGEDVPAEHLDGRTDEAILAELEEARRANTELLARVAALESAQESQAVGALRASAAPASAGDPVEPYDGYDDSNADSVIGHVREDGRSVEELEAILAYERQNANRKTVVAAVEHALDTARE